MTNKETVLDIIKDHNTQDHHCECAEKLCDWIQEELASLFGIINFKRDKENDGKK